MNVVGHPARAAVPPLEAAWCTRWPEEVAACFRPDGVRHRLAAPQMRAQGRAAIAQSVVQIIHAVPDCLLEVVHVVRGDDTTVLEWVLSGTHLRDLPGVPARGLRLEVPGVSLCRMDGALIREERVYWDAATLLAQAGAPA